MNALFYLHLPERKGICIYDTNYVDYRYSAVEFSMEETSNLKRRRQTLAKAQSLNVPTTTTASNNDRSRRRGGSSAVEAYNTEEHRDENADGSMEVDNSEMWNDFSNRFRQVQSVLDRNRLLIQQVNENHQARSHNNMVQNVGLIQELNGNISKVVSLYSDLSTNFSSVFHQGNDAIGDENNNDQTPMRLP